MAKKEQGDIGRHQSRMQKVTFLDEKSMKNDLSFC